MKHFFRLLTYTFKYKGRFFAGVVVSFFVAVLNGLSMTAFIPLFDALGDKQRYFEIQVTNSEIEILNKSLAWLGEHPEHWEDLGIKHSGEEPVKKESDEKKTPDPENENEKQKEKNKQKDSEKTGKTSDDEPVIIDGVIQCTVDMATVPRIPIPENPKAVRHVRLCLARRVLNATYKPLDYGLDRIEYLRLRTLIRWKLRINAHGHTPLQIVYIACMVVLPLYLLKLVLLLVSVRLIAKTGYMAVRDIRDDLYSSAQTLPLTYYYREKTGMLMSRMINDVEIVAAVISSNMRDAITNVFYILVHLLLLAYLNLELLIICAVLVPLILSPVTLFTRKIRKSTTRSQELLADVNAHVLESIAGIRVIRAFGMEAYEEGRFRKVNHKLYWRVFKQNFYLKVGPYLVEFFSVIVSFGVIGLGAYKLNTSDFTSGKFIAFFLILMFILRPIIQLSGMYSKIISCSAAAARIFEIMDTEPDIKEPAKPRKLKPMKEGIEFRDIHFIYPGTENEVLKGIDLKVPRGSTVALVGESGGGKSTMMDLLARFFDSGQGGIYVDDVDIRDYSIRDHRSRIGVVTQDIFLFYGTIRQNIAYGQKEYTDKDIEKAARLAYAHDFIEELPEGYDTVIGERGFTVSGGQRQRIAIARALLRDPEILILDEATSALDTESERLVQHALERLFLNRTTFVVAHRLSTIEKADMIVVVSEGQIDDIGAHAELMERGGTYARLQEISRKSLT